MSIGLDGQHDYPIEAMAALIKGAVNTKLDGTVGGEAIKSVYGAPLPLPLLPQSIYPAMCVYRLNDTDRDMGDGFFEDSTVFQLDYYVGATPRDRIDDRWPALRRVWEITLGALRSGSHSSVADGADILRKSGLIRYVLGSGKCSYVFAASTSTQYAYPMFRAQVEFNGCYPSPDDFIDSVDKCLRLDRFKEMGVDWNVVPQTNDEIEMQQETRLPQD